MAVTGKTGADAIAKAVFRIALVSVRYQPKLAAVITQAESAGAITSAEGAAILAFLATIPATKVALEKLAQYSGF